jgi:hypothetical protein
MTGEYTGSPVSNMVRFWEIELAPSLRTYPPSTVFAYILPSNCLPSFPRLLLSFRAASRDSLAISLLFFLAMQQFITWSCWYKRQQLRSGCSSSGIRGIDSSLDHKFLICILNKRIIKKQLLQITTSIIPIVDGTNYFSFLQKKIKLDIHTNKIQTINSNEYICSKSKSSQIMIDVLVGKCIG